MTKKKLMILIAASAAAAAVISTTAIDSEANKKTAIDSEANKKTDNKLEAELPETGVTAEAEVKQDPEIIRIEKGLDELYDLVILPSAAAGSEEDQEEDLTEAGPETEAASEEVIVEVYEEPVEVCYEEEEVYEDSSSSGTLADIGTFTVTFYCPCAEHCNGSVGALGVELTPWYSIALPDYSYLGRTFYVDGFGYFRCEDVSPAGICDIFVSHHSEIPSYGMTAAYLWEVTG